MSENIIKPHIVDSVHIVGQKETQIKFKSDSISARYRQKETQIKF